MATCRLCSEPITDEGFGFYHDGRNLGVTHGIRPHFATPMQACRVTGALVPVWTVADSAEAWEAVQQCDSERGEAGE
jgi:hypothetical protein